MLHTLFLLAASTPAEHIRGILAACIIPVVIVILVVVPSRLSKKKNKKIGDQFLEELKSEHPFKESFKGLHITEDGHLIYETYDGVPLDNNSITMTRAQKAEGYKAYTFKLEDIKNICLYTHVVKMVNKYGHGNQVLATHYLCLLLGDELQPIYSKLKCTGKLDKKKMKKYEAGEPILNAISFGSEADSVAAAALIKKYAPHVNEVDYESFKERKNTRDYMAKK